MKKAFPLFFFLLVFKISPAQNFTGQWKGEFVDNSTAFIGWGGDRCEYVLELECKGNVVKGYSYTYFNAEGKKYYTICALKGFIKPGSKYVEVKEYIRTKTNVPSNIRNCFQVHKLTFTKAEGEEKLSGSWVPAPEQDGDCGFGTTVLTRRVLTKIVPTFNRSIARSGDPKKSRLPDLRDKNKVAPVDATVKKPVISAPVVKNTPVEKQKIEPVVVPPVTKKVQVEDVQDDNSYAKRNNAVMKTIELDNESFKVDLYDNGTIDGDTISLFYNNKLLLSHKRLSDKAISLTLAAENKSEVNELVMYADNLGEIPPNTALMVVTDGPNRYEVRITSDLQKSGVIRFVYKGKP